jgi:uncharacterized protein
VEATTVVGLLAALVGPHLIAYIGEERRCGLPGISSLITAQAALLLLCLVVLLYSVFVERLPWYTFGLDNVGLVSVALGLPLAAFLIFIYGPAVYAVLARLKVGGFELGLAKLKGLPTWYLVFAVAVGGVAEEFLYRGYAFERIAATTGSPWLAGAIPLLLFSLAHVRLWGWPAALTMLVSGGIMTLWYAWHRDLVANIIAHCVTDFYGIVMVGLGRERTPHRVDA